ncbi:GTPase [Streptomyces sp. PG2]
MRPLPAVRGRLLVAVAGRTKSGKTTLRKALTRETDRSGIGRGAHRTTRRTSAFDVGPVTYLDTPGFAAKDDDFDAQHARAACDRADAVIWNYAETMRDEEAAEFRRLLLSGKPLLAVVNVKGKVDEPARLRFFADYPEREFRPASEHTARIEQVARAAGAVPPVVLAVHSGAAHESLSAEDRELGDRALRASRLPELERALSRLLAERSIPLRAVRLAEEVRRPLAAFGDRAAQELPRIGLALDALERSMPVERAGLLEAFRNAGRDAHERLEAARHQARERLPETVQGLGGEGPRTAVRRLLHRAGLGRADPRPGERTRTAGAGTGARTARIGERPGAAGQRAPARGAASRPEVRGSGRQGSGYRPPGFVLRRGALQGILQESGRHRRDRGRHRLRRSCHRGGLRGGSPGRSGGKR